MRIAVCGSCAWEAERICGWIDQYCHACGCLAELCRHQTPEQLRQDQRGFFAAFIGFGGETGFRTARELRDRDRQCRIVILDDTSRYAVQGHRIHATYFIVRPLEAWHITRSLDLILGWRDY